MFPSVEVICNNNSLAAGGDFVVRSLNPSPLMIPINNVSFPQEPEKVKKKRNQPGHPDPDSEVIALSPRTLLATNRFVCEVCNKGFQRDQNLQLHRRGHNLPWKLKQRNNKDNRKRVYVCPERTCVHHDPSRALGDLTGIKKHYCRKHGEKKFKCDKCSKIYAVQSDWKAHMKTCGTREYKCDCGSLFTRRDSFVTHRAFCDALAEETARISSVNTPPPPPLLLPPQHPFTLNPPIFPFAAQPLPPHHHHHHHHFPDSPPPPPQENVTINNTTISSLNPMWDPPQNPSPIKRPAESSLHHHPLPPPSPDHRLSATALLQKAASLGSHPVGHVACSMAGPHPHEMLVGGFGATWRCAGGHSFTRDFMGLTNEEEADHANVHVKRGNSSSMMLKYAGGSGAGYERDHHALGFGAWRT